MCASASSALHLYSDDLIFFLNYIYRDKRLDGYIHLFDQKYAHTEHKMHLHLVERILKTRATCRY